MYKMDYEKLPLKLWNYAPGCHRDGPWRILHNKLASQGKTIVSYLPSMQDEKRAAKELTYNTKRDSEHSNTKSPSPKKVKGMN